MGKREWRPLWNYEVGEKEIQKVHEEKDLGNIIQDNLKIEKYIERIFRHTQHVKEYKNCIPLVHE